MEKINITLKMQCEDCGHIQTVKGFLTSDGGYYFGSAYSYCDECDGLPNPIEEPKQIE
jgi:hypothetical protein